MGQNTEYNVIILVISAPNVSKLEGVNSSWDNIDEARLIHGLRVNLLGLRCSLKRRMWL